ncbi:DUF3891 family protein [Salinigranum halophilum]|uniref:DUF3891 family protein n=1 Tax=Salinigranum halophilum TaxID=2565931 RepID=UPI00115CDCB2|nr:DUF3891 family protein [Salinigranum halophilum]
MIVATSEAGYRLVTQNEHGAQVGQLAAAWGGDAFAAPDPRAAVRMAAALHDAGWWEHDFAPRLVDGAPASVIEASHDDWTAFYDHGIVSVAERDPYAGLLCALHGAGVRRQRYGTQPSMSDRTAAYASFIETQEDRQRELLDALVDDPQYAAVVTEADRAVLTELRETGSVDGPTDSGVWRNFRLLEAWDRLSLYCCRNADPEPTTLEPVPLTPDAADVALELTPVDATTVRLDPYPFVRSPMAVPVRARTIPARDYGTETALRTAYYDAPLESVPFEFVA